MATQSLYRRYRPRRFGELKGQDHVVRALRDAVRSGREGQAYLFSGPRGTGKTSSARILAKVLNCEAPEDGEPCCECESCLAVERGTSYDVHELDAASNNGVDAIRDLIEKASLGTPGRHKVYILDEVHMLSRAAEAALLKTLEEPPSHVVFVLATTDPQKMSDTIRSRTQHLQFHLLAADTLVEHVQWVAADAGIELPPDAIDAVIAQGGGSARDTLSALELMAATGGELSDQLDLDRWLAILAERDAAAMLAEIARSIRDGHEPRMMTEALIRHLRDGFLALMAPELVQLPSHRVAALTDVAHQLGAAAIVAAMEQLGAALVEMRHAPDPRVLLEVSLIRLTHAESAHRDLDALSSRLDRLEAAVRSGVGASGGTATPAPTDPASGKAVVGGRARRAPRGETAPTKQAPAAAEPAPEPAPEPEPEPKPEATSEATSTSSTDVPAIWESSVRASLKPFVRALYSAGSFSHPVDGRWCFDVPNDAHRAKCEPYREEVEQALSAALGVAVGISLTVGGLRPGADADTTGETRRTTETSGSAASSPADAADEDIDLDELIDAPPEAVLTPIDRLAQAFPGAELIDKPD